MIRKWAPAWENIPCCAQWRLKSACTLQSDQSLQYLHEGMMHPWLSKMHPVKTVSSHFTIWAKSSESAWGNDASLAIQNASGEDSQLALYNLSKVLRVCMREWCILGYPKCTQWRQSACTLQSEQSLLSAWGNDASLAIQNAPSEDSQLALYNLSKVFRVCMREWCILGYSKCTQWRQSACTLQSEQSLQSLHEGMMHPWLSRMHLVKTVSLHFTVAQSLQCLHEGTMHPWLSKMHPVKIISYFTVWSKSSVSAWGNDVSLAIQNAPSEDSNQY